jgi:NADH-quinone oxidoreductase subunit H
MVVPDIAVEASRHLAALEPDWPGNEWWHWVVFTIIIIAFVLVMIIGVIYIERRAIAWFAARTGPNRTGPFGLLQAIADAIKILLKEFITPINADKIVFWIAPAVVFAPVIMIFAVVPFMNGAMLADLNIGVLFVVAISSISTVGVFMAGWSSSNKYSMIGAMRLVASVISYEIPVVLSLAGVVLIAGSLSLNDIVLAQQTVPFILVQPLGFFLLFVGGCAEINRSPFDLMEADSELVAGFHTEYSGMKFAMYYLGEYGEAVVMATIISTLFLGGWQWAVLPGWLWLILKIFVVFFTMVWTRATLPRVRIDQLMAVAWKFLFPLALINLLVTALQVLAGWPEDMLWLMGIINYALLGILILLWSRLYKVGWGRIEV